MLCDCGTSLACKQTVFNMATKKGKGSEKKSTKRNEEEVIRVEDRTEDIVKTVDEVIAVPVEELPIELPPPPPEPEPEPVYEEPVLTQLIVERLVGNSVYIC